MQDMKPMIAGTNINARVLTLRIHPARELTPGPEDGSLVGDDPQGRRTLSSEPGHRLDVACKCIST